MHLGEGRYALVAREVSTNLEDELHLIDLPSGTWVAGSPLFGDDEAIVSDATLAGAQVLVADNSAFSGISNRIGVATVGVDAVSAAEVLSPFNDPYALWASPSGLVLVASGFGDALLWLAPGEATAPYVSEGEITYAGTGPALPGTITGITRGTLSGLALVAENTGVRLVDLSGSTPVDHGLSSFGDGLDAIPGALGVAP